MTPARRAWRRLLSLETKHDRRLVVAVILSLAYVTGWIVLRIA